MSRVIQMKTMAEVEEEAAAWVWRLDGGGAVQDRRAFEEWIGRDPRHRRAFEELGGVWQSLDALAEAKREEKIATFASGWEGGARVRSTAGRAHRPSLWFVSAAAVVLMAIGVFGWLNRGNEIQTLSTAVGQQRMETLADGSIVRLNTNTILETHLVRGQREIRLLKGEALFSVAHDPARPFLVYAGDALVRALGTEFNVRLREGRDVEVVVAEGRVEVQAAATVSSGSSIKHVLNPGQRFETQSQSFVAPLDPVSLAKTLAWRDGAIVFDGEPLSQAIAELNRYTDTRFVVSDPVVGRMPIGGRFKAGDVDEFLQALQQALPVSTRRTAENLVYIESRP